ncbi:MAG: hypothetical protein LBF34_04525 [Puniceicoccales bacterium]|nr:hypothetical protein [Puniceicoccales bacterium]
MKQALPPDINKLGGIGGDIPGEMKASSFGAAKLQLNAFADAIFKHPNCKGLYSADEQAAVKELVIGKALEYLKEAGVKPEDAMKLVRDNLIKIHHQQTVDHQVISGSDHGVRHVIQSNVAHTLHALDALPDGLVSPKDKLMAMQIMIDHDLGYTTDAAKGDLGASKDHPLASAAYLEMGGQNSGVFTDDDQKFMRDAVLKHSYPFGLDQPLKFSNDAERRQSIAGIISVVDAMGTTGDTKCPAIFREGLNFDILANLRLGGKEHEEEAKQLLHDVIDNALREGKISQEVAEGYHMAVSYDMNFFGAGMIVPQFGGELLGTQMEQSGDGYALHINFGVSENIKNLAVAFNGADVVGAFDKAAGDLFKLSKKELDSGKPQPNLGVAAKAVEGSEIPQTFERGAVKLTMTPLGDEKINQDWRDVRDNDDATWVPFTVSHPKPPEPRVDE